MAHDWARLTARVQRIVRYHKKSCVDATAPRFRPSVCTDRTLVEASAASAGVLGLLENGAGPRSTWELSSGRSAASRQRSAMTKWLSAVTAQLLPALTVYCRLLYEKERTKARLRRR